VKAGTVSWLHASKKLPENTVIVWTMYFGCQYSVRHTSLLESDTFYFFNILDGKRENVHQACAKGNKSILRPWWR